MAWSPFQRANAGIIWVEQPGDYANPIPTTAATGPLDIQMELTNHVAERAPTLILSAFACALSVQRQKGASANRA